MGNFWSEPTVSPVPRTEAEIAAAAKAYTDACRRLSISAEKYAAELMAHLKAEG